MQTSDVSPVLLLAALVVRGDWRAPSRTFRLGDKWHKETNFHVTVED